MVASKLNLLLGGYPGLIRIWPIRERRSFTKVEHEVKRLRRREEKRRNLGDVPHCTRNRERRPQSTRKPKRLQELCWAAAPARRWRGIVHSAPACVTAEYFGAGGRDCHSRRRQLKRSGKSCHARAHLRISSYTNSHATG